MKSAESKFSFYLNGFGLLLLAICFGIAAWRVMGRSVAEADPDRITIRFAHWQLEGGVRDAFNAIARDYEALHPNVRVEQLLIPERYYTNWITTQLIGGTAPDLIQLGNTTLDPARVARFFTPVSHAISAPNPYNVGTDLEGRPWRDTFIDGMEGAYNIDLFDTYSVSPFTTTVRVYINLPLLRLITGSTQTPRTYEEFVALSEKVQEFAARTGRNLHPLAGSRYNAPMLLDQLFGSQLQRLARDANPLQDFPWSPEAFRLAYLEGHWNLDNPEIRNGFALMRDASRFMPRGFTQLERDDAMFYFVQQRALMLMTGSWDVTSIRQQVPFELGVFRAPIPTPGHPQFGAGVIARNSEGDLRTYGGLHLTRLSRNPEAAIDFLRFLTSKTSNQKFTRISGWLPVIHGVEPAEFMRGFMPDFEGVFNGPAFTQAPDLQRLFANQQHLLFSPNSTLEDFFAAYRAGFETALRSDTTRTANNRSRTLTRNDITIEALHRREGLAPYGPGSSELTADLLEAQNDLEARILHARLLLARPR